MVVMLKSLRLDVSKMDKVLDWLMEEDQPAIRYLALRDLIGASGRELGEARRAVVERGWVKDILEQQTPMGVWVGSDSLYTPKYLSTNWMLLILADLGVTKEVPSVKRSAEIWMKRFAKADGGFGMDGSKSSHLCVVGNTARALVQLGYKDRPEVKSAFRWLESNASHLGGWSCFGSGRNLDSWEPLSAFAVYPRQKWSAGMKEAVEKAVEFFLQRELHTQGDHYEPWFRFHYPVHYYYDLLVGLDAVTSLGYSDDRRLDFAVGHMKKKRSPDGRWNLDAVHPDVEGPTAEWFRKHPKRAPTPFALEKAGRPSKMITLRALRVLRRLES
jgi:hypothetical protein